MITELLKSEAVEIPWPILMPDGSTLSGRMGINDICTNKCREPSCHKERSSLIGTRCQLGLTVYEGKIEDQPIRVFGVVGPQHKAQLPTHPDFKNSCKGRSVTAQEFSAWINRLKSLSASITEVQNKSLAEALEPLHDAMRLARDVAQLADQVLNEATPRGVDKFEAATPTQKALVKTSSLLVDTFDLIEIYLNPKAAAFGQPRSVEIYKLLDKLAKIAGLARRQEKKPSVYLNGSTRRSYDVYESFKLIPLTLIDNAQKYSRHGGTVTVEVTEEDFSLLVKVISEGALLSLEEQKKIFHRGYRG